MEGTSQNVLPNEPSKNMNETSCARDHEWQATVYPEGIFAREMSELPVPFVLEPAYHLDHLLANLRPYACRPAAPSNPPVRLHIDTPPQPMPWGRAGPDHARTAPPAVLHFAPK